MQFIVAMSLKIQTLKTTMIGFFVLILLPLSGLAQQDSSGVYKTSEDYKNRELSFAIDCNTQKHKIKSDQFHHKDLIRVTHNDSLFKLLKNDVFGYLDCKGQTFRMGESKKYTILNPYEPLQLYKHETRQHKRTALHYYFSKQFDSPLILLTMKNLIDAFEDNQDFLKVINVKFKRDAQLTRLDKRTKRFVLSDIYSRTTSKE